MTQCEYANIFHLVNKYNLYAIPRTISNIRGLPGYFTVKDMCQNFGRIVSAKSMHCGQED